MFPFALLSLMSVFQVFMKIIHFDNHFWTKWDIILSFRFWALILTYFRFFYSNDFEELSTMIEAKNCYLSKHKWKLSQTWRHSILNFVFYYINTRYLYVHVCTFSSVYNCLVNNSLMTLLTMLTKKKLKAQVELTTL